MKVCIKVCKDHSSSLASRDARCNPLPASSSSSSSRSDRGGSTLRIADFIESFWVHFCAQADLNKAAKSFHRNSYLPLSPRCCPSVPQLNLALGMTLACSMQALHLLCSGSIQCRDLRTAVTLFPFLFLLPCYFLRKREPNSHGSNWHRWLLCAKWFSRCCNSKCLHYVLADLPPELHGVSWCGSQMILWSDTTWPITLRGRKRISPECEFKSSWMHFLCIMFSQSHNWAQRCEFDG